MLEKIDNWLRDQKRTYAFGIALFMALASVEIKKKYSEYLSENADEAKSNDPRFPFLINKVTDIYNKVRSNPNAYAEALAKVAAPTIKTHTEVKKIIALKNELEELNAKVDELEESDEDKTSEIEGLQEALESKNGEIDELKATLKEKGIKVMDGQDLPPSIKAKYDRVKEIVPLMAAIHGELKDTTITDAQRKVKADELCKLDDERRSLWDDIDAYLSDYNSALAEEKKLEYSDDPVIRGMQMGNRLKRLKENITRTKTAIDKHIENKKPELEEKAREKLSAYEVEFDELTNLLNEAK